MEVLIEMEEQMKKKKSQLQLDEELARKMQEEELAQLEAEREAVERKKKMAQTKRKPSITKVKQDKRRRMVTFLKSALNVNAKMLTSMSFKNLEDLYKKEMKNLQGDTERRDELERKLKAQHDVQKPFPEQEEEREKDVGKQAQGDDEQTRQDAELAKKLQEELDRNVQTEKTTTDSPSNEEQTKAATSQSPTPERQIFKRKKMTAKRGPRTKKAKAESEKEEATKEEQEGNQEENPLAMVVNTSVDATPLQSQAPTQPRKPKIVKWFITDEGLKHVYTFVREDTSTFWASTFARVIKIVTRDELEDIIRIGMTLYNEQPSKHHLMIRMAVEQINIMLDTEWGKKLRMLLPHAVLMKWELFENCGVYSLLYTDGKLEFYLVEKKYIHPFKILNDMISLKLSVSGPSMMASRLVAHIKDQIERKECL